MLTVCAGPALFASVARAAPAARVAPAATAELTADALDRSLDLGRQYLLNVQRPDGSFIYELEATRGVDLNTRHAVREMAGLWMMARLHRRQPTPETSVAIVRGLKLQDLYAKQTAAGGRYLSEPGARDWTTNVVALHALTLLDFLATDQKLDPAARAKYERDLAESVTFLLSLRMPTGRFYPLYRVADGRGSDAPSPYSDGQALLALVRAAKEQKIDSIREAVLESAAVMYGEYVKAALRNDPHSEEAVSFYQWGSMAFYELYTSGWPDTKAYGARTVAMARWMTDVNKILQVPTNGGAAFEGLTVAWELARLTNDAKNQKVIGAVIEQGMSKLLTWQIGGPDATSGGAVPATFLNSPKSRGGILTGERDPRIRTDMVVHQLNAELFARTFMFRAAQPATSPAVPAGRSPTTKPRS